MLSEVDSCVFLHGGMFDGFSAGSNQKNVITVLYLVII